MVPPPAYLLMDTNYNPGVRNRRGYFSTRRNRLIKPAFDLPKTRHSRLGPLARFLHFQAVPQGAVKRLAAWVNEPPAVVVRARRPPDSPQCASMRQGMVAIWPG